jgi:hypothetical protein
VSCEKNSQLARMTRTARAHATIRSDLLGVGRSIPRHVKGVRHAALGDGLKLGHYRLSDGLVAEHSLKQR